MNRLFKSLGTAAVIATAILLFSVYVLSANLPRAVGRPDAQEFRSFSLPAARLVRVINTNGTVQVRAVDVAEITIQADVRAYDRGELGEAATKAYAASLVQVHAGENMFEVVTEPEDTPEDLEIRVDYSILLPQRTDVDVTETNGNIWISEGCGDVRVLGQNSDIEVIAPEGSVEAESTNGRVRVTDAPNGATIRTFNGNIYAHMSGGALDAVTTNGAIVARVLDRKVAACKLSSQNGGITVLMPESVSASIDAVTKYGSVRSDFEVKKPESDTKHHKCRKRRLNGTIGSGDTRVRIETLNGNIWVAKGE